MRNRPFAGTLILVTACGCLLLAVAPPAFASAQSSHTANNRENPSGDKMAFDATSVKQDKTGLGPGGTRPGSNVPFAGNAFKPTGGLFRVTNLPLTTFIAFAYKLDLNQTLVLATQVSRSKDMKWVLGDRWDIEARAEGNPTKDQYRLMMQSLLADRFELAVHMGTMQAPIYLVEVEKAGKLGPQLTPRAADAPCSNAPNPNGATNQSPIPPCGAIIFSSPNPGRSRMSGRAVTMQQIVDRLGVNALPEQRPAVDRTGLSGIFDFTLEWAPHFDGPLPPGYPAPDPTAPSFLEAIKDQLGIRLEPATGPINVLIIDAIEEPTPN